MKIKESLLTDWGQRSLPRAMLGIMKVIGIASQRSK
jgi:hypothetical protein